MSRGTAAAGAGETGERALCKDSLVATLFLISALLTAALFASSASAAPPEVTLTTVSAVTGESATLEANVNPGGIETAYHFEYGPADCASSSCTSTADATLPAGSEPERVTAQIKGLTAATTYHFRVVAKNGATANGPDTIFTTFPPGPLFGSCANDAFRVSPPQPSAALPDCRAYEQASPVEKGGLDARSVVAYARASLNGDRISFLTAGGIPGGEGSQELPSYLASRSGANWSTQGLLPPASIGEEAFVLGWTPDFSEVFDSARKFNGSGGGALLMRSIANGSLTKILDYGEGLTTLPPLYAGATGDGSEVLFESTAKLTAVPAALEGRPNLYLWDRDTDKIALAGVLNDKSAPPAGAFAGPYDWIGGSLNNGGTTANYYTQDEHAISADGKSVYFTAAASGRLHLRVNPAEEQSPLDGEGKCTNPALACTIQVSASQKTNGEGPGGRDSAGAQPAALMEATPDGSVALFTSSEKLTNDANTGPELQAPAIARANVGDGGEIKPELIPTRARGMAVDGTYLYWANPSAGTIERAKLDGKEVDEAFITDTATKVGEVTLPGKPQYVAVDGEHVYWTNAADGLKEHGTIGRADLADGANPEPELITGATNPQGIDAEGELLYWSNAGKEDETRTIGRAKTDGGEADPGFIAVGNGSSELTPQGLAVNATQIYTTVNGAQKLSQILRFEIDGDPASRISLFNGKDTEVRGLALDATHVYWARQAPEAIGRAKLDFTEPDFEFIEDAGHPLGVAVDGEHIFWSTNQESPENPGNDLYRYEAASGELSDLTALPSGNGAEVKGVLGSSADGSVVYFAANGDLDGGGPAQAGDCKGTAGVSVNFSGECSLYLLREGSPVTFIARLEAGGETQSDAFNWLPHVVAGQREKTARVSADGQTLLFRSQRQLTAYENEGTPELYRYRIGEGIGCVSCNPTGAAPTGIPSLGSIGLSTLTPTEWSYTLSRNLSADGNRVFFETTDALVGADTNGAGGCPLIGPEQGKYRVCLDVYEWEAQGSGSCKASEAHQGGGCIYLLSSGKSPDASYIADASVSGDDVFLFTRDPFVRQDQDQLYDVYDAHVGGGLTAQNEVPVICTSREACGGGSTPAPPFESPGSASFTGPGDPKPKHSRKHKKAHQHKAKKHAKNKKHAKAKKHRRAAKKTGRAGR